MRNPRSPRPLRPRGETSPALKRRLLFSLFLLAAASAIAWIAATRRPREEASPHPAPGTAAQPSKPVDLTKTDGRTVDFSSGKPVVKDSPEDQAAIDAALEEMRAAAAEAKFGPADKEPAR